MSASATGPDAASASPAPDQVTVLSQLVAKPGRESDVCDSLLRLAETARAAPGNLSYDLHRLKNNPAAFYVLANWADQAAFDRQAVSTQARAFLDGQAVSDLVAPPMLTYARPLSRPDARPDRPQATADSPAQVTLVPFFTIKPSAVDAVRRAHLEMLEPTREEPGCLGYDLYQSRENSAVMFFYENWSDSHALATHMNTPNFYRYVRGEVDPRLVVPWTAHMMALVSQPSR
ncbi:MAG TPA: putative quinol monooxygenase [Trebonia sp.]